MIKPTILLAGKRETGLPKLTEFINHHAVWAPAEVATAEEAIEKFHQQDFDLAILTDGISSEEEKKLRRIFTFQNPEIIIIRYNDDNDVLLMGEITNALEKLQKARRPSYSLVDDALKNAGLNIIVE
jgi:hypothetical protein